MDAVRLLVVLLIRVYGSPMAITEVQGRRNAGCISRQRDQ